MQAIVRITTKTVNRGERLYTISINDKGQYFAHEIGDKTQWAKAFNTEERLAHRLNPSVKYGNQYVRSFKPKPFTKLDQAIEAIVKEANTCVLR